MMRSLYSFLRKKLVDNAPKIFLGKTFLFSCISIQLAVSTVVSTNAQEVVGTAVIITNGPQFGQGYNPTPEIVNVNTYYNGIQPVLVTRYEAELGFPDLTCRWLGIPKVLAGTHSPMFVKGLDANLNQVGDHIFIAYTDAAYDIQDNTYGFYGSLNFSTQTIGGAFYLPDNAASAYWGFQKFEDFLLSHFGWMGIDQLATKTIRIELFHQNNNPPYPPQDFEEFLSSHTGGVDGHTFLFNVQNPNNQGVQKPYVSADIIGHEYTHAIMWEKLYAPVADACEDGKAIIESFCDIMGISCLHSIHPVYADDWIIGDEVENPPVHVRSLSNPNLYNCAEYYHGLFWKDPGDVGYDYHKNGGVMNKWYYLLVEGTAPGGETNSQGIHYEVDGLSNIFSQSENLAMNLVFRTMTEKFENATNYPLMRQKTLEKAVELGFTTDQIITIEDAWNAVGVGPGFDPDGPPSTDPNPPVILPLTWYNGPQAIEYSAFEIALGVPNGPLARRLEKSGSDKLPAISTRISVADPYVDIDGDGKFAADNDPEISKNGVSVHWATERALSFFNDIFKYNGLDGQGKNPVLSYVGTYSPPYGYKPADNAFYYEGEADPQVNPDLSLDVVASHVTKAIEYNKMGGLPSQNNPEAMAVYESVGQIFGVVVKNWNSGVDADQWDWKFGDDVVAPQGEHNLQDPKANGDPCMYQGEFYMDKNNKLNEPVRLAGVMNKWFELLTNGGSGYRDKNPQYGAYYLPGVGAAWSIRILFDLMGSLDGEDAFIKVRNKTLDLVDGYQLKLFEKTELIANLTEAWYAVGVGDREDEVFSPKDQAQNVDMWPTHLSWEGKYNGNFNSNYIPVDFEVMLSEDGAWGDPTKTRTMKCGGVTINDVTGHTVGFLDINVNGSQKIQWKVRPTAYMINGNIVPAGVLFGQEPQQLASQWSGIRELTTKPMTPELLSPLGGEIYPWQAEFQSSAILLMDHDEKYHYRIANKDNVVDDTELEGDFEPDGNGPEVMKRNLRMDKTYSWTMQARGPEHTIRKTESEGVPSGSASFHTKIPKAKCKLPDGAISSPIEVPPFGFKLEAQKTPGARGYLFEISTDQNFSKVETADTHSYTAESDDEVVTEVIINKQLGNFGKVSDGQVYYWRVRPYGPDLSPVGAPPGGLTHYYETGDADGYEVFKVNYKLVSLLPGDPNTFGGAGLCGDDYDKKTHLEFNWTVYGVEQGDFKLELFKDGAVTPVFSNVYQGMTPRGTDPSGWNEYGVDLPLSICRSSESSAYKWTVTLLPPNANYDPVPPKSQTYSWGPRMQTWQGPGTASPANADLISFDPNGAVPNFIWTSANTKFWEVDIGTTSGYTDNLAFLTTNVSAPQFTVPTNLTEGVVYWISAYPRGFVDDSYSSCLTTPYRVYFTVDYTPGANNNNNNNNNGKIIAPDIGFDFVVIDDVGPQTVCTFECEISVTAPDGTVVYQDAICSNSGGIIFVPASNCFCNGDLPEQEGNYTVDLTITNLVNGEEDYSATPSWYVDVYLYDLDKSKVNYQQVWPLSGAFGGRYVGSHVTTGFSYSK